MLAAKFDQAIDQVDRGFVVRPIVTAVVHDSFVAERGGLLPRGTDEIAVGEQGGKRVADEGRLCDHRCEPHPFEAGFAGGFDLLSMFFQRGLITGGLRQIGTAEETPHGWREISRAIDSG